MMSHHRARLTMHWLTILAWVDPYPLMDAVSHEQAWFTQSRLPNHLELRQAMSGGGFGIGQIKWQAIR